jgi:hypothetical protein
MKLLQHTKKRILKEIDLSRKKIQAERYKKDFQKLFPDYDLGRKRIVMEMSSVFQFGKYKGFTTREVINRDPKYIKWLVDSSNSMILSKEANRCFIERYTKESI